ncbi:SUKH-4 family immunity protein [Chitinophaga varians]|uniref:SUKH-4 family immunity protein n=1 Tax=Chitinophaga varians TaxID=2202339 RepID=UPI00165EFE65|nr:SUKH-4 family immunity protein [Chitinophaga varians]MBC9909373.1 SUKH-4 family immunity protein [Chitinophaga varians]
MINQEQLKDLYQHGAITFTDTRLRDARLPEATIEWLRTTGLPAGPGDRALGIHLEGSFNAMLIDGKTYRQIGYEWEHVRVIALEETTGAVYSVDEQTKTPPAFVNTSLPAFLLFLQYFQQYQQRRAAYDTPVAVYTREEMLQRLEQLKNKTMPISSPGKEKFDQEKEFKAMKAFFEHHDVTAIHENNWWSFILEQVEDDLL